MLLFIGEALIEGLCTAICEGIGSLFEGLGDALASLFEGLSEIIGSLFEGIGNFFAEVDWGSELGKAIGQSISGEQIHNNQSNGKINENKDIDSSILQAKPISMVSEESKPIPILVLPSSIVLDSSYCTLSSDHPLKSAKEAEDVILWLIGKSPIVLPDSMLDGLSLDSDWKLKYNPLDLEKLQLEELKNLALGFGVEPSSKKNLKASWIDAIAQKEKSYLDDFLSWSDALARSLK